MKTDKLYEAISDIREEFIEEAETYTFKKNTVSKFRKWGSMAACFCLIVLGATLVMNSGFFARKGAMDSENGAAYPTSTIAPTSDAADGGRLTVLAYNGALYNVSNELNVLNIAGIPDVMTQEDCGASLGNLIKTENGYEETVQDTDIELYQYAPAYSNTAVYVIRDGNDYMAGLFSNNLPVGDENDYSPISELFRRYGVDAAEHISAVQLYSGLWNNNYPVEPEEHKVTEKTAMEAFYEAAMSMEAECYSKEDYLGLQLEEDPMQLAYSTMSIAKTICITTEEGLKFYLNWAEESGWMFSAGAAAYYKVTDEMQNWLDTYIP